MNTIDSFQEHEMVKSMTAFAKQQNQEQLGMITWEVRSVNSRFLDLNFRLPETFREFETDLRNVLKKYLTRGKIDIILHYTPGETTVTEISVNQVVLNQLSKAIKQISKVLKTAAVDSLAVLRWPGVLQVQEQSNVEFKKAILTAFEAVLTKLNIAREKEGASLAEFILLRLEEATKLVAKVASFMPEVQTQQRQRLLD